MDSVGVKDMRVLRVRVGVRVGVRSPFVRGRLHRITMQVKS